MKKETYANSLECKYRQQARQASQRGLGWFFTFETWLHMWEASGKLHLRGKGAGKYVMARRGDVGPYSPENCFICPFEQNIRDGHKNAGRIASNPEKKVRTARGWTYVARSKKRPYQVMLGDKYVGSYATQEEAEGAFKGACEARRLHALSFVSSSPSTPLN